MALWESKQLAKTCLQAAALRPMTDTGLQAGIRCQCALCEPDQRGPGKLWFWMAIN